MALRVALLVSCLAAVAVAATPPLVCPAGAPIGNVDLRVQPANSAEPLPLKNINRLEEGDSIIYRPILRTTEHRRGEVAIVLVPAVRHPGDDPIIVLDPRPAAAPASWKVPTRTAVAAFVYGPSGLSRRKVERFLAKDDELVAQLADYAEKTQQTEALIAALSDDSSSSEVVNSAFQGFASHYGSATGIDRTLPPDQQLGTALRTINPAVSSYDPIAPAPAQRASQTVGLATAVAALFFGSPVGLAAGGTAMLLEMHSLAFPNIAFRSSFAQPLPGDALGLCGKRDAVPTHTRVAYLWATRIPNIAPPDVLVEKLSTLPEGLKSAVAVKIAPEKNARYLNRARGWGLVGADGTRIPVIVKPVGDDVLELDLAQAKVPPGNYSLRARWDWDEFPVQGELHIVALSDFAKARLPGPDQDRLIAKSGRVPVTLRGSDFEFTTKLELARPGDKFFQPQAVPFVLANGFRAGPQNQLDIQINTVELDPGDYRLKLTQADGKAHEVPIAILPAPPRIDNLPLTLHQGDAIREITLKGTRLDAIARIEGKGISIALEPASRGGEERKAWLQADPGLKSGACIDARAFVVNRSEPVELPQAVTISNPRPRISDSRLSLPQAVDIAMNPGELPAGFYLSAMLEAHPIAATGKVTLFCRTDEPARTDLPFPSGKSDEGSAQRLSPTQLFVTFDDSRFPNGCELLAQVTNAGDNGASEPYPLGRIVRIPKITSVDIEPAESAGGFEAKLGGRDLEVIDRAGWDPDHGTAVSDLPMVAPDSGRDQELHMALPGIDPADGSTLYLWLRGESTGRAALVHVTIPQHPHTPVGARLDAKQQSSE